MDEPTMETLARRLDRMERENRWLKRVGVAALAVITAVVLMGQWKRQEVVAERFVVRGADGKVQAVLGEFEPPVEGYGLTFHDEKEKVRIALGRVGRGRKSSLLTFAYPDRRPELELTGEPFPRLGLYGKDMNTRIVLSMIPYYSTKKSYEMPVITLNSEDGSTEIKAGMSAP